MSAPDASWHRRRRTTLAGVLCVTLNAMPCAAQAGEQSAEQPAAAEQPATDPERLREAGRRYEAGLSLYSEGDFALAVIEFERAFSLVPDYRVLFNIGQVRIQLGQYARARSALEHYLDEGGERVTEQRRASVTSDLEMLAARTATLRVQTNVADAEVLVDDELVGRSPLPEALLLDAGEHRVVARKPGYRTRETRVTLAGRDDENVLVELSVLPERQPTPIVVTEAPRTEDTGSSETLIWASWSTSGALAAGTAISGFLGIRAANNLDELRSDPGATRAELDSAKTRARSLLIAADLLGAAAVASGGVALYLTLSRRTPADEAPERDAVQIGLAVGPGFTGLSGRY